MKLFLIKLVILWCEIVGTYRVWKATILKKRIDRDTYCCDGSMCGCQGVSTKDFYLASFPDAIKRVLR